MEAVSLVTVRVSDIGRALRFYRDQLGLPLRHVDGSFHEFDTGGALLAIDSGGVAGDRKGADRCPVEIHLQVADIGRRRVELEAQGVNFEGGTHAYVHGKFARFFDPDGNPLVLYEPGDCPLKAGAAQG